MIIEFDIVSLKISRDEASELFYSLRRDIKHSIASHWRNHPDAYLKNEAIRLQMLDQLNRLVDVGDVRKEMHDYLTECVANGGKL